ncbi:uncharacterized protein LOC116201775 isoform X2 [Punica granatum]|uniref:Uncharacterized protein LOC116201775 isoform X2 n=1 Tax=Punica granatum TaxID=22663 RepID=A0A6P8CWD1_PUNGR|nr:uncharacterized protein LOC116201775 isoform X2 [Punica granatum]
MKLNQHIWEEPGNCFGGMGDQEDRKPAPTLSVIQRLDRLDHQILEERHGLSARHPNDLVARKVDPRDECKSISSVLEEVHQKGTLVERVAMLEDRVLQLSLEIDSGNTWKSNSSCAFTEKIGNSERYPDTAVREKNCEDAAMIPGENNNLSPLKTQKMGCAPKPKGRGEGKRSVLKRREWFGCFRVEC